MSRVDRYPFELSRYRAGEEYLRSRRVLPTVTYPKLLPILIIMFYFAVPQTIFSQNVVAWFSNPSNSAAYGAIADEVEVMAQQLKTLGLSDSILAARLEEGYRKRVNIGILAASLRTDTQRAVQISAILRKDGVFPTDKKTATSVVEQMLIFMRAGLSETELESAVAAGVSKAGKSPKATSRALAALASVTAVNAQSKLSEEDRLKLVSELIASELYENQFESSVEEKRASKFQGERDKSGHSSGASQGNQGEQNQSGHSDSESHDSEDEQDDQGSQSQGSHDKK